MITIDPMHTFLLGMVKDERENSPRALSGSKRSEFFRRIKTLNVPYGIGRLPSNMKEIILPLCTQELASKVCFLQSLMLTVQ